MAGEGPSPLPGSRNEQRPALTPPSQLSRHLLGVLLPLLEALSRAPDVRPVLQSHFDMAGWFGRRGVCMYERPDRTLTAAATLTR